ncbi:hypothetical protein ACJIZ3_011037 [Penstemon smallii]|uniref:Cytochrome P450 n=1 Tax=Penstemon smallii TaxID=265156 RepID=A0ABD3UIE3_9LAMI
MFLPILLLALMIIILLKQKTNPKNPPGPLGLPFIGNLHQFNKSKPHIYLYNLSKTYGPLTYLKHGSTPVIVINSKKLAKQILKTNDLSFCTRPPVLGQQKLAYEGIDIAFSPYNDHWKNMRKICVLHLFSSKQVFKFRPIREDEVSRMVNKISKLCSMSKPINLSDLSMSLASNLICRVAFGKRYDDCEYEKLRFDKLVMEAQALMVSFYFSDHFPAFGWVDKLSGLLGRLEKNCKELDVFYKELIDEHLNPSRQKMEREDIIDLMIQLKEDQDASKLDLTWDHIKALLMDLLVAGTDTVAAAVVWSMTTLITRPEIMRKAQAEIREVIGKNGIVDEEDVKKMKYLKGVVLEVLRMYPPAPLLFRKQITQEECLIEGYKIRSRTTIVINGWAIGRDPETWKNPDEFKPERFMISSTTNDDSILRFDIRACQFEMIPFGGGRRGCPGMEMGLISIELALANLLYAFDWALPQTMTVEDIDTNSLPGLTMHKKNALVLMATSYI